MKSAWWVGGVAMFVAITAGSAYIVGGAGSAEADQPRTLDHFRDHLESFQTLWLKFEFQPTTTDSHASSSPGVLRIDKATGRISLDRSSYRILWDGTHLWLDTRPDLPAHRLGDEADAMAEEFVEELLNGLPNTNVISPQQEDWGHGRRGWRLDLPFSWDDTYAILLSGREQTDPTRLTILDKQTKEPVKLFGNKVDVPISLEWDVRLLGDLSDPEGLASRNQLVGHDGWDEIWEGPSLLPGYHAETTQNDLAFDANASLGWNAPSGVEIPQTRLGGVICPSGGTVVNAPIQLRYTLDMAAESAAFLPDALAAGCPLTLRMGVVLVHAPVTGAKSRIQGTVRLRDTSTNPPTVLAQQNFEDIAVGPGGSRRSKKHELNGVPTSFNPNALELRLDGTVEVRCITATSEASSAGFGTERETPPQLSWPGCYPELGVVP